MPQITASFYRSYQGKEVDFVLTRGGEVCGIEFKAAKSVKSKDFGGLLHLQKETSQKTKGIVLYTGDQIVVFAPNMLAVPVWLLV